MHPYVSDVGTASVHKRVPKKKASSIDFGNQLTHPKKKNTLRNSHVFVSYHNQE